jgi:hypothetical protein
LAERFPGLKESNTEGPGPDKLETLNLAKANEIHEALVEAMDEDEPVLNHGGVMFGMVCINLPQVTEKLKHFPLNSARAKKIFDKYFKKGGSGDNGVIISSCRKHQLMQKMLLQTSSSKPTAKSSEKIEE